MLGTQTFETGYLRRENEDSTSKKVEAPRNESYARLDDVIKEFESFLNDKDTEKEIKRMQEQGIALNDIMYELFYTNKDEQPPLLKARGIEHRYKSSLVNLRSWLGTTEDFGIEIDNKESDVYVRVGGGVDKKRRFGRMTLNLKNEALPQRFKEAALYFRNNAINCDIKIPSEETIKSIYRSDKMVIYFNNEDSLPVLRFLERLNEEHPDEFNEKVPRFTNKLKNRNKVMPGIAFGEDSGNPKKSFGDVRSEVLEGVYNDYILAKKSNIAPDFRAWFQYWCTEKNVDPRNPAFNIREDIEN